jgi:hypothetical protein
MTAVARERIRYDFAVYDPHGRLTALVEVKRRFGTDRSWAKKWHATMAGNANQPADANVVLVVPDRVYVWRPGASESANPDWTFESAPWLAPYFSRLKIPVEEVAPRTFEEIVGLWLQDVVGGEFTQGGDVRTAEPLLDALRGGEVVRDAAA